MNYRIRLAHVADVAVMHRVRHRVRENRLAHPDRITEATYLPYIAAGSAWVAETDAGVVGFAAVDASARSGWALFIDPDAEGAGFGRAMHLRLLTWAQEQRLTQLTLSTEEGTRAARFYKRAGWVRAGTTPAGDALFAIDLREEA